MSWKQESLAALDQAGYVVLDALTYGGLQPKSTHSRPTTFACMDGKTYWAKNTAQQGLAAELIAGRLGAKVGASPMARIIRVTAEAVPPTGEANHLRGVVVGIEDIPGTFNARDLQPFIGSGQFQTDAIDAASRARVVVFQSWLGVRDTQVLVRLTDGHVFSIDHGDCFDNVQDVSDPTVVLTSIPGVSNDIGKAHEHVLVAVQRIQSITDSELLESVAKIPVGEPWRSPADRRLQIAVWLAHRRDRLQEVMEKWLNS